MKMYVVIAEYNSLQQIFIIKAPSPKEVWKKLKEIYGDVFPEYVKAYIEKEAFWKDDVLDVIIQ